MKTKKVTLDEAEFRKDFELISDEINGAIQSFYTLLEINNYRSANKEICRVMNKNPSFWNITLYGLQVSFFMSLGRIFDTAGPDCHTIDKFIASCITHPEHFQYEALKKRKQSQNDSENWLDDFMKETYQPTVSDFEAIEKAISVHRTKFNQTYKKIRHYVFAHNIPNKPNSSSAELFAKTNKADIEEMLSFLHNLQNVIWKLFYDGIEPNFGDIKYFINRDEILNDVKQVMDALLDSDAKDNKRR